MGWNVDSRRSSGNTDRVLSLICLMVEMPTAVITLNGLARQGLLELPGRDSYIAS